MDRAPRDDDAVHGDGTCALVPRRRRAPVPGPPSRSSACCDATAASRERLLRADRPGRRRARDRSPTRRSRASSTPARRPPTACAWRAWSRVPDGRRGRRPDRLPVRRAAPRRRRRRRGRPDRARCAARALVAAGPRRRRPSAEVDGAPTVVIDAAGAPEVLPWALDALGPAGSLRGGRLRSGRALDLAPLARKELAVRGVRSGRREDLERIVSRSRRAGHPPAAGRAPGRSSGSTRRSPRCVRAACPARRSSTCAA